MRCTRMTRRWAVWPSRSPNTTRLSPHPSRWWSRRGRQTGHHPATRDGVRAGEAPDHPLPGSAWTATPVDRVAHLCRHRDVELGLVTDGRWWALVWAPRGRVTATAVFDSASWAEAADRDVVRAFVSLLSRRRRATGPAATGQPRASGGDHRGPRCAGPRRRRAAGRGDWPGRRGRPERGEPDLAAADAHDVYRGAVSMMMRVVFLLFAEERGLLPADNELYARAYSAGRLRCWPRPAGTTRWPSGCCRSMGCCAPTCAICRW